MAESKRFRVPSRYMAVQRHGQNTHEILDAFKFREGIVETVATGFSTIEDAMRWIWSHDLDRANAEAQRIAKTI
jgi:hypothetical protein